MHRYRITTVVAATLLLAAGCGKSPADRLVGQWQLKLEPQQQEQLDNDREKLAERQGMDVGADVAASIVALLDMRLEITADEIVFRGGAREVRSSYQVVDETDTTVTIEATRKEGDGTQTRKGTITFVSDDEIQMSVPGAADESRTFVRLVPDEG